MRSGHGGAPPSRHIRHGAFTLRPDRGPLIGGPPLRPSRRLLRKSRRLLPRSDPRVVSARGRQPRPAPWPITAPPPIVAPPPPGSPKPTSYPHLSPLCPPVLSPAAKRQPPHKSVALKTPQPAHVSTRPDRTIAPLPVWPEYTEHLFASCASPIRTSQLLTEWRGQIPRVTLCIRCSTRTYVTIAHRMARPDSTAIPSHRPNVQFRAEQPRAMQTNAGPRLRPGKDRDGEASSGTSLPGHPFKRPHRTARAVKRGKETGKRPRSAI